MRTQAIFSLTLVFFILLAGCAGQAPAASEPTARVSEVAGLVEIMNPGQETFSAAPEGASLEVAGQLRSGSESQARLELASGTIVRIAPETLLTLDTNAEGASGWLTHLTLAAGQVWVVLDGGQLEVETPSGTASVRGSYMSVWVDPLTSDVWVTCLEGWCQAENPAAVIDMVAGQGCLLYHWDPQGSTPPPPKLRYLSQEDIAQFLDKNPEAAQVMSSVIATASALPTLAATSTPTPLGSCFSLGLPANGGAQDAASPIVFDWGDQPGAYKYILTITKPNGVQKTQIAWNSTLQLEPGDLPFAGTYQWQVTAYDSAIQPICTAGPWSFVKAESPAPTPAADCFQLLAPLDLSGQGESGPLTFSWNEQPGRLKYILTVFTPQGGELSEKVYTNSLTLELGDLPTEGSYTWQVTAYDTNYNPICTAGPWSFTKPGTPAPTPDPNGCVTLLSPADGTHYEGAAEVEFTWSAYPDAYKYIVSFKPPSTPVSNFLAWTPSHVRFVESFVEAGTYQWWVTVKDHNLQDICTSPIFTFSKADTSWVVPPSPEPGQPGAQFWGQTGPTGSQPTCGGSFSVNTSLSGTIKLVYADNPGFTDFSYVAIGSGPGSGSTSTTFPAYAGKTVYWRFAVVGGSWVNDSYVGSFTCP